MLSFSLNFDWWYRDTPDLGLTYYTTITLTLQSDGVTYLFDSSASGGYFPLDALTRNTPAAAYPNDFLSGHQFSFTTEIHT